MCILCFVLLFLAERKWKLFFYFFHRQHPLFVSESTSLNHPLPNYPSLKFEHTKSLQATFKLISSDGNKCIAHYVLQYDEKEPTLKAASSALLSDFIINKNWRIDVGKDVKLYLKPETFCPLVHKGSFTVIYHSSDSSGPTDASLLESGIVCHYQKYEVLQPELGRAKQFTHNLLQILEPLGFIVEEQNSVTYYCEYKAKADLVIKRTHTLVASLLANSNDSDESVVEPMVEEYEVDKRNCVAQTLAGMLAIGSDAVVQRLRFGDSSNAVTDVIVYGVSAYGEGSAYVLKMHVKMHDKNNTFFYQSQEIPIQDAFNYALSQL